MHDGVGFGRYSITRSWVYFPMKHSGKLLKRVSFRPVVMNQMVQMRCMPFYTIQRVLMIVLPGNLTGEKIKRITARRYLRRVGHNYSCLRPSRGHVHATDKQGYKQLFLHRVFKMYIKPSAMPSLLEQLPRRLLHCANVHKNSRQVEPLPVFPMFLRNFMKQNLYLMQRLIPAALPCARPASKRTRAPIHVI